MDPLPYDVIEMMVQCFGRCFHYKDPVEAFFTAAGVSRTLARKDKADAKFVWSRKVLSDLGQTEEGAIIQRKILGQLCNLRNVPDKEVVDRDSAMSALQDLKECALSHDLVVKKKKKEHADNAKAAYEKERIIKERAERLADLHAKFVKAVTDTDRQNAGYSLEDIITGLFQLAEIEYRPSYRTITQQIDGAFTFQGFDYLVEAKWRNEMPTEGEIGEFQRKVRTKLESTRGVFVSAPGFRPQVVQQYCGQGANLILMDGEHLMHVLEGRMELKELLRRLIEAAAHRGLVYVRV